jgi:hypothetical protein
MTDTRTEQLSRASYRGQNFGVRREAQDSSGRKIVLHEYVNSPMRFIEDLGQNSPTFTIEAFVHGNDYLAQARQLESALNLEGKGLLTLPSLGSFKVEALSYRKTATQQNVGEITYSLVFATGRPSAGPAAARIDTQQVYVLGDAARQQISTNTPFTPASTPSNIAIFSADITATTNSISDFVTDLIASTEIEDLDLLNRTITRNSALLTQRVADIGQLFVVKGATKGIWQAVSLGSSASTQLKASFTRMVELTKFGSGNVFKTESRAISNSAGIPVWPSTTQQRIERNNNRISLINLQRANALIVAYELSAAREYETQTEIDEATSQLGDAHEDLMLDATEDTLIVQSDPAVRFAIEEVRFAALTVISQKKQATTTTTIINQRVPISAFVLAYDQYSDDFLNSGQLETQAIELRALNPARPASALFGETTIFRT